MCLALSAVVLLIFILFYNNIFSVTFDEDFAKATGMKADGYNLMIAVVSAVVIVLSMRLVGALLISALIIFPALSAMVVFKSFRSVICCAAGVSVLCAAAGIVVSILLNTPVGATIVTADLSVFILMNVIGVIRRK